MNIRRAFAAAYLTEDPRSVAVGRIALALVLLYDLARRAVDLRVWYTNEGLLPNHTVLWSPPFEWTLSFFFGASHRGEAVVGFVACACAYLALLVGYRTRLAHVVSAFCVLSLHGRVLFIQSGGDIVLVELCLWTMFLPGGQRFSIDSLLGRLRDHAETTDAALSRRETFAPRQTPVVSLAVMATTVQLAIIYAFNAIQKDGPTWRQGSVLHYMLHQDEIVTGLGVWVRGWLTPGQSRVATYGTLAIEAALPFALLSPFLRVPLRRLAIILVVVLHGGFAALLTLGVFAPAMIAFTPHLISTSDWDALERWRARRARPGRWPRIVWFDGDCGICFLLMRILARLCPAGRFELRASRRGPDADPDWESTIVVTDPAKDRRWVRGAALAEIVSGLPGGFVIAWTMRLPGVRGLLDAGYEAFARRRATISAALGLAACGAPDSAAGRAPDAGAPSLSRNHSSPSKAAPWLHGVASWSWGAREGAVALLIVLATSQVLVDNPRVTHVNPRSQPRWMTAAITYLQFLQPWMMYAPDAPKTDANIYVDAVTADGRHVDPLNEVASPHQPNPGPRIPPRLGQSILFSNYVFRLPGWPDYFPALTEWILRYPDRTGHANDRIVSFEAFQILDDSPPPGEREPRNTIANRIISYP